MTYNKTIMLTRDDTRHIIGHINDCFTWTSARLISVEWHKGSEYRSNPYLNHFRAIYYTIPNKLFEWPDRASWRYDWAILSPNPSIRIVDILRLLSSPINSYQISRLNWDALSINPGISYNDMLSTVKLGCPWVWWSVCSNPGLTIDDIVQDFNGPRYLSDWDTLTANVSEDDMKAHPRLPWKNRMMDRRTTRTGYHSRIPADYSSFWCLDDLPTVDCNWDEVSQILPIDLILEDTKLPWSWKHASSNISVRIQHVTANPKLQWDYVLLSSNPGIKPSEMFLYTDLPWDICGMSKNPSLEYSDVVTHRYLLWHWPSICKLRSGKHKDKRDAHPRKTVVINNESDSLVGCVLNIMNKYQGGHK